MDLPKGALKEIVEFAETHYYGRMYICYLINIPESINSIWEFLNNFIDDTIKVKV